jgi:hypothetical protein
MVPTNRSAKALACGARTGVRMIRIRSERKASSKLAVNFTSRSRTSNRTGAARSASTMVRLRACWTGLWVPRTSSVGFTLPVCTQG